MLIKNTTNDTIMVRITPSNEVIKILPISTIEYNSLFTVGSIEATVNNKVIFSEKIPLDIDLIFNTNGVVTEFFTIKYSNVTTTMIVITISILIVIMIALYLLINV